MERRNHPRFSAGFPVSFSGEAISGEGSALNLSKDGCLIVSDNELLEGDYLQLRVHLSGTLSPVDIEVAAVRWVAGQVFGVQFLHMQSEQHDRLNAMIDSLQRQPAR